MPSDWEPCPGKTKAKEESVTISVVYNRSVGIISGNDVIRLYRRVCRALPRVGRK